MGRLVLKQMEKLNTKRLLSFHNSQRKKFYAFGFWCGCGCGEIKHEIWPDEYPNNKEFFKDWKEYLNLIKTVLDKREHVEKK